MATKNGKTPYTGPKRLIVLENSDRIITILCRERSGKFIEHKSFSDCTDYKKYKQRLSESSESVKTLKIENPWADKWRKRYDLAKWKDDPDLVLNVPKLLSRFKSLCDDDQHCPRAQAPLLLLGTFLSGYLAECFRYIEELQGNPRSKVRAVIHSVQRLFCGRRVLRSRWRDSFRSIRRN